MKLIRSILFTYLIFFVSSACYAQLNTYDLSEYILPNIRYIQSSLEPNFSTDAYLRDEGNFVESEYQTRLNASQRFFKYVNNENNVINSTITSSIDVQKSFEGEEDYRTFQLSNNYMIENKFYNESNLFWGYDLETFARVAIYNYESPTEERKSSFIRGDLTPGLKIGFGRIQNIQPAWRATTILKDLNQNQLLKRIPNHEEITAFANALAELQNVRALSTKFIDSRFERNERFLQLCEFLISNDFVENNNPLFYTILYDTWRFENFISRRANNEFSVGARYDLFRIFDEVWYRDGVNSFINYGPEIYVSYTVNKPIDHVLQLNGTNEIKLRGVQRKYYSQPENVDHEDGSALFFEFSSQWELEIWHSVRTRYSFSATTSFDSEKTNIDQDFEELIKNLDFRLSGSLKHFVSPQILIDVSMRLEYRTEWSLNSYRRLYSGVDAGFNYFFR